MIVLNAVEKHFVWRNRRSDRPLGGYTFEISALRAQRRVAIRASKHYY